MLTLSTLGQRYIRGILKGRGKFTKITISLNSTKTKISYKTMKNVKENYHRL